MGFRGKEFSEYRVLLTVKWSSSFWGHLIGAFPIFADVVHVVSQKRLVVEQNGTKIWASGVSL